MNCMELVLNLISIKTSAWSRQINKTFWIFLDIVQVLQN